MEQQYSTDPADWIIEKYTQVQPSWGNSRVTYRLRYFDTSIKRYEFIGEKFWIMQIYAVLREYGVVEPEKNVRVVDLDV